MDRAHGPLGPVLSLPASKARRASPPKKKSEDLELVAGARAHFEDPLYYAKAYATRDEDIAYYVALGRGARSVLEHGIGNGRIALPLARAGVKVTGVDHSEPMLEHLRTQLALEPLAVRRRVTLQQGDMRTARPGGRFPLVICPFNAALHLYTRQDVEAWLARVREQLAPGGELVFDISMPLVKDLARDPSVPYSIPPFVHPTAGRVKYHEHFDYDPVRQIQFISMFFEPAPRRGQGASIEEGFMTPLAHRQFFPQEMEALLHYNGFEVVALHGDFDGGPLVARSDVMIWHARPRRTGRRR